MNLDFTGLQCRTFGSLDVFIKSNLVQSMSYLISHWLFSRERAIINYIL